MQKRHFNVAGPCFTNEHYMIHFTEKKQELIHLIEKKNYFVLHAARQTGKTTTVQHITRQLNRESNYYAFYCSLESVQPLPEPERGMPAVLACIKKAVYTFDLPNPDFFDQFKKQDINVMIYNALHEYCKTLGKPLVIFFDEADCLSEGTLIIFLRQLRDGYISRTDKAFPHSISLIGMRNLREYKSRYRNTETTGSVSPFNIITESLSLKNFSLENITALYQQHTEETEQIFEKDAIETVYDYTSGQPWLVNAIARECVEKLLNEDYSKPITKELVVQAINNIIVRRDVHIDSLLERLKDDRVKRIMQPVILGENATFDYANDDAMYCLDLGLISVIDGELKPSNKIYQEVIIRSLNYSAQFMLGSHIKPITWIVDNQIDMNNLLKKFQQFWRENSAIWAPQFYYPEAAPHLLLQAFLQRVINGGGHILREYALGRMRMDICVIYGEHKYPIEIKLYYGKKTKAEGIEQLTAYMDSLNEKIGWLVIFDQRKLAWSKKITWKTENIDDKTIHVLGC